MGRWFEKHLISIVFGFIGTIFAFIGGGFLWGYFHTQQELKIAGQIPLSTIVQLTDTASGASVAVEGRISEKNTNHLEGLVVYIEYQYQGLECDDDCEEVWRQTERITPGLWLDLPDGRIRVSNTDYALLNPPERWQTRPRLIEYETLEYQGFRMGNPVYAMGEVNTGDGISLNANFLYGGSRQDYLANQSENATVFFWMGGIFAAIGLIFLIVAMAAGIVTMIDK